MNCVDNVNWPPWRDSEAKGSLYGGQFTSSTQLINKTKLSCNTLYRRSTTVSLETYPLHAAKNRRVGFMEYSCNAIRTQGSVATGTELTWLNDLRRQWGITFHLWIVFWAVSVETDGIHRTESTHVMQVDDEWNYTGRHIILGYSTLLWFEQKIT